MRREYLTGRCLHEAVFSVTVKEQEIPLRKRLADLMSPPHPPGIRRTLALQMSLSDEAEGSSINNKAHRRGDRNRSSEADHRNRVTEKDRVNV